MAWKRVEEMSAAEVVSEAESLARYAERCRESGQGINSKEVVRYKACSERMVREKLARPEEIAEIECMWDERNREFRDLLVSAFRGGCTLDDMRKLFTPA